MMIMMRIPCSYFFFFHLQLVKLNTLCILFCYYGHAARLPLSLIMPQNLSACDVMSLPLIKSQGVQL